MKISWNRIKLVVGVAVSIAAIVSSYSIGHVKGQKTGRLQSEIDWTYINLRLFSMSYRNNRKIPEEIADRYGFNRQFIDPALLACVLEIDYTIGITNILDTIEDEYDKRIFLSTYNKAREYCAQMPQARYYPDVFPCELAETNHMDVAAAIRRLGDEIAALRPVLETCVPASHRSEGGVSVSEAWSGDGALLFVRAAAPGPARFSYAPPPWLRAGGVSDPLGGAIRVAPGPGGRLDIELDSASPGRLLWIPDCGRRVESD